MGMRKVQKCAVINDLSGFGRCALTVAIPILSAMGIQACPVPTAILSNHTGYDDFFFEDFTDNMETYFSKWKKLGLKFDAIYTGFLGNEKQIETIVEFVKAFKSENTLLVVDPVMGDNGKLYATYTNALCEEMKKLVKLADVITPNLTEACILTDTEYPKDPTDEQVKEIGEKLLESGAKSAVITGVRRNGRMINYIFSGQEKMQVLKSKFVACEYCGTGDVFASLLCGYMTKGINCKKAVKKSEKFLVKAIKETYREQGDPLDGIDFERFLRKI